MCAHARHHQYALRQRDHIDAWEVQAGVGYVVILIVAVVDDRGAAVEQAVEFGGRQPSSQMQIRQLLGEHGDAGYVRRGLTGAVIGNRAAGGVGAADLGAGCEDGGQVRVALGERRDAVGCGGERRGSAAVTDAADVGIVDGADRQRVRIRRGVADALSAADAVKLIARGRHHNDIHRRQRCQFVAQSVMSAGCGPVLTVAERHVDAGDVVCRSVGHHPLQRRLDVAEAARAGVVKDLQVDNVHAGRHAGADGILRGDDAGHVRPVAVDVLGVGVLGAGEVLVVDDPVRHAVAVGVRAEEGVVQVDARVEDDRGVPAAIDAGEALVVAEDVHIDQGPGFRRRRAGDDVVADDHPAAGIGRGVGQLTGDAGEQLVRRWLKLQP